MKGNKLSLNVLFVLCVTSILTACGNMTGSNTSEAEDSLRDLESLVEVNKTSELDALIPDGMSIDDVTPTRFFRSKQQQGIMSSMGMGSGDSYTLELLLVPEGANRSIPQGFNNNGSVLYSVQGSGYSGMYLNSAFEDTLAIYEGPLPNELYFVGDLNDKDEVVFFSNVIDGLGSVTTSFTWSDPTGLNEIDVLGEERFLVYANNITNNSTVYGSGGARADENTSAFAVYQSDIFGNSVNYSSRVGHDFAENRICYLACVVANDEGQVAFKTFETNEEGQLEKQLVGLTSSAGELQYFPVSQSEIASGAAYMNQLFDMNNDAKVVGDALQNGVLVPALWEDGQITLLSYPDQYSIIRATSINNSGYIAGYGFNVETNTFDIILWSPDLQFQAVLPDNADLYGGYPIINDHNEIVLLALVETNGSSTFSIAKLTKQAGDNTPPVISFDQLEQTLWPVDHKLKLAVSGITANDDQDTDPAVDIRVRSSEALNGTGDGNTKSDWEIKENADGSFDVFLRAERDGANTGRIYIVEITATDESGNTSSESVTVSVGHDRSGYKR